MLVPALLALVAFVGGFVDAIAGGGGLLTVPALLVATPDARIALGTNKGQSVFGALASLVSYARAGRVHRERALRSFVPAFLGSLAGVRLVFALRPETLRPVVLGLLVLAAAFFALHGRRRGSGGAPPPEHAAPGFARRHPLAVATASALVLGTYDGFFGPGTGTFLIALYAVLLGDDLTQATANAKVANFASNLAAVLSFALAGKIDLRLALPMAGAQMLGGLAGARTAIRGGEKVVRGMVLVVTTALAVRIGWQILAT
jgi:hypothetical protein